MVKDNPYRLAMDIFGIGFKTADSIARKIGIPSDSPMRARAGILFVLNQMAYKGHCFLPLSVLIEECGKSLEICEELINEVTQDMDRKKTYICEDLTF